MTESTGWRQLDERLYHLDSQLEELRLIVDEINSKLTNIQDLEAERTRRVDMWDIRKG